MNCGELRGFSPLCSSRDWTEKAAKTPIKPGDMLLLLACVVFSGTFGEGQAELPRNMSCYQCRVERLEDCADPSFLRPCPPGAHDRCMTTTMKRDGMVTITKSCTLAPCEMAFVHGLPTSLPCDTSAEEYTCADCCREDGCNAHSTATSPLLSHGPLLLSAHLTVFVSTCFITFRRSSVGSQ